MRRSIQEADEVVYVASKEKKLDYDSSLEKVFNLLTGLLFGLAGTCVVVAAVCFLFFILAVFARIGGIQPEDSNFASFLHPLPVWLLLSLPFFGLGALLGFLRTKIDIHYYIDPDRPRVMLRRKLWFYESVRPVAKFASLLCVSVSGHFVSEAQGENIPNLEYWNTALFLVTRKRKLIRVSNFQKEGTWKPLDAGLHTTLGIPFVDFPDSECRVLCVSRDLKVSHRAARGTSLAMVGSILVTNLGCLSMIGILYLLALAEGPLELLVWGAGK
jgi:hypothetical protein